MLSKRMKIKIGIQQPTLPTYRKSLFEKLGDVYDITIYFGKENLKRDFPENVNLHYSKLFKTKLFRVTLKWHWAQLKAVNKKFDCSILNWDVGYITFWLALLKSMVFKIPLLIWGHGYSKNESALRKFIRDIPLRFVDAIILYDYNTYNSFKKKPALSHKIFVAPNSLDDTKISKAKEYWLSNYDKLKEFIEEKSLENKYNLIYVGRIYRETKPEYLIFLIKNLVSYSKNFNLILIGGADDKYLDELKNLAKNLLVFEKIVWVGSLYDETYIAPYMLASKIFVYPEDIGLSLIHAFNYSLPVITHNIKEKHGPEIFALENQINGLLHKKNDIDDYTQKVLYLYENESIRKQMGYNALESINKIFNINNMLLGFHQAIKSIQN